MSVRSNIEKHTDVEIRPEPRPTMANQWRAEPQVNIHIRESPGKRAVITLKVPAMNRSRGIATSVQLRTAEDVKELAEIAAEAHRYLTESEAE